MKEPIQLSEETTLLQGKTVLSFDTPPYDRECRFQRISEANANVLFFDLRDEQIPSMNWSNVSMTFVSVWQSHIAEAIQRINCIAHLAPVVAIMEDLSNASANQIPDQTDDSVSLVSSSINQRDFQLVVQNTLWMREVRQQQDLMSVYARRIAQLTPRQLRILQLAAEGEPNKRIARLMSLSVNSIERIRREAYRCLDVGSSAEMTRALMLGGLHTPTAQSSALAKSNPTNGCSTTDLHPKHQDMSPRESQDPSRLATNCERHAFDIPNNTILQRALQPNSVK